MSTEQKFRAQIFLHSSAVDKIHCFCDKVFIVAEGNGFVSRVDLHPLKFGNFFLLGMKCGFVKGESDKINDLFFNVGLGRIFNCLAEAFAQKNAKTGFFADFAKSGFHFGFSGFHMAFGEGPMAAAAVFEQKDMGFAVMLAIDKATTGFFVLHFKISYFGKTFTKYNNITFGPSVQV